MRQCILIACGVLLSLSFNSCESCTKQAAKKATNIGFSLLDGVSEAVSERGEQVSEKAADALGVVAKGVGKSLERQLDEHAEYVASVAGRTLVQTVEGLDKGTTNEYYTALNTTNDLCEGVSLDYFGKINSKSVIDAYFIIIEEGKYKVDFDFVDNANKSLMKKTSEINKLDDAREYTRVSFALNDDELDKLSKATNVKVKVTK